MTGVSSAKTFVDYFSFMFYRFLLPWAKPNFVLTLTRGHATAEAEVNVYNDTTMMSRLVVHTTPGDDWTSSDHSVPRCCWWTFKALLSVASAPPPTNLPITSSEFFLCWGQGTHKLRSNSVTHTGMSTMQSSAWQSLVTQCKNTVDIFWCLCLTKRKTSKEKRPIWLFPFSNTVVCGSLEQLCQKRKTTHNYMNICSARIHPANSRSDV